MPKFGKLSGHMRTMKGKKSSRFKMVSMSSTPKQGDGNSANGTITTSGLTKQSTNKKLE